MNSKLPSIYGYNDFRKYLAEYQAARQSIDNTFTKSEFSRRMRLPNTRSYFIDVLKGKKVTATFIERFTAVLDLEKDEARFFRALVQFNQAETLDEREFYFDQLISLNRTPKASITPEQFAYYKNWYNSAVRALLNIYAFDGDFASLARKVFPAITPRQAKDCVSLLKRLGLVTPDKKGILRPTNNSIAAPDFLHDELIRQYQLVNLEQAKSIILKSGNIRHMVATNTLSISKRGYDRLVKHIEKFRSEVRSLIHKDEDPADRVYNLNLMLLPSSQEV